MKIKFLPFLLLACAVGIAQDLTSDIIMKISSDNTIKDLSGYSTPVLSGMETYVTDRSNNPNCAIYFGGRENEFIKILNNESNSLVHRYDQFTVSLWFKMDNVNARNYEILFQKRENDKLGFSIALHDLNTPVVTAGASNTSILDDNWNKDPDLRNDTTNWHHLAIVFGGTYAELYRDNVLQNSSYNFARGSLGDYFIGKGFKGALDDFVIYKRVLTIQEIDLLYKSESECNITLSTDSFATEKQVSVIQKENKQLALTNLSPSFKTISIFNLNGSLIWEKSNILNSEIELDLSLLSSNTMYIMQINDDLNTIIHKIILK